MEKCQLKKQDEWRWILPKQGGMNTEGLIYAAENMLGRICQDKAHQQVANVASLPGIVGRSLAMPDIHWGYGFPIGGVAAFDINNGVISPGGIGYDINCLDGNTPILHKFGYTIKIKDFEKIWNKEEVGCFSLKEKKYDHTKIANFIKIKPKNNVFKLTTETGYEITATEDHPFYTKNGMVELKNLALNNEIAVYPFEGVPYENTSSGTILALQDIFEKLKFLGKPDKGNAYKQITNSLKEILPLKYDSPALPYILKLAGYCFGDGNIHFVNKTGKGIVSFWGKKGDLQKIKDDIRQIGFTASIYKRKRSHSIHTQYSEYSFNTIEYSCIVRSSGFAILLAALGVPVGNKTKQDFYVPKWLLTSPLWQKRMFLASFFGAEMSSPKTITDHGYNFYCPAVSMNKREGFIESGKEFFQQIGEMLKEFNIKINELGFRDEFFGKAKTNTSRIRLGMAGDTVNLINLYSKIGFEYNSKRSHLANAAIQFLKIKDKIIQNRQEIEASITKLRKEKKLGAQKIHELIGNNPFINLRFIERTIYEGRKGIPRIAFNSLKFDEFTKIRAAGTNHSGMFWEKITKIDRIPFNEYVYDFTVENKDHNFIANNLVVSNCGVRLLRTNLYKSDIENRIHDIIYSLFSNIPSGVGSTGKITLKKDEVKKVLAGGAKWAIEKGYGCAEDLQHTEENGCLAGADADKVSGRALERGTEQLGTLGAGNHFLEIQEIEQIYDEKTANDFGLFPGQITIMVHTGSRGLGYQVCDDSIRNLQSAVQKYKIQLADRQLVCAPVESQEGRDYYAAMAGAANYAWANRQIITHWIRQTLSELLGRKQSELGLELVYDVAHNIGKFEEHSVLPQNQQGSGFGVRTMRKLFVHRKGATRAFPGMPVIIPGTMGTASYVMAGTQTAMDETWGSTCHGAGRMMSRTEALRGNRGEQLAQDLGKKGIFVKSESWKTLAEEAPQAYKDVNLVVDVCHQAGISKKVVKMRPLGVIKG